MRAKLAQLNHCSHVSIIVVPTLSAPASSILLRRYSEFLHYSNHDIRRAEDILTEVTFKPILACAITCQILVPASHEIGFTEERLRVRIRSSRKNI